MHHIAITLKLGEKPSTGYIDRMVPVMWGIYTRDRGQTLKGKCKDLGDNGQWLDDWVIAFTERQVYWGVPVSSG